jgi:hypothetical protein
MQINWEVPQLPVGSFPNSFKKSNKIRTGAQPDWGCASTPIPIPNRAGFNWWEYWIIRTNCLLVETILVIGIGSLRWFRFNRPAAVQI